MINKRDKKIDRLIKKYMGKKFCVMKEWYQIVGFRNNPKYPILVQHLNNNSFSSYCKLNKEDKLFIKPDDGIIIPTKYTGYIYKLFSFIKFN